MYRKILILIYFLDLSKFSTFMALPIRSDVQLNNYGDRKYNAAKVIK